MSAPQDNPIIRASRAAAELPCSQATDQPTYDNITRTAIVQYTQKLSLPLRIIGAFSRRNSCAMQWLVLSTASAFPDSFGTSRTTNINPITPQVLKISQSPEQVRRQDKAGRKDKMK